MQAITLESPIKKVTSIYTTPVPFCSLFLTEFSYLENLIFKLLLFKFNWLPNNFTQSVKK